jgi:hypothetical protein
VRAGPPPRSSEAITSPGRSTPTRAGYDTEAGGDDLVGDGADVRRLLCGVQRPLIDGAAFCGSAAPVAVEGVDYVEDDAYLEEDAYLAEPVGDDAATVEDVAHADEAAVVAEPFSPAVDTGYDVGGAAPAAVLYADPTQAEPLPPQPEGSWGIADPVFGGADDGRRGRDRPRRGQPGRRRHRRARVWAGAGVAGAAVIARRTAADHAVARTSPPLPRRRHSAHRGATRRGGPTGSAPLASAAAGAAVAWEVTPRTGRRHPARPRRGIVRHGHCAAGREGTAVAMPYGSGAVESSAGGSKTGFIGLGAAARSCS